MANAFRQILIALRDPRTPSTAQLRKAAVIAQAAGSRVELFHAINEPVSLATVRSGRRRGAAEEQMAATTQSLALRLERLARRFFPPSIRVTTHAEWDFPPHEAVIRRAGAIGADLVIAAAQPARRGSRVWLTNTDWELIRHCPHPLLLVKSPRSYDRPSVLVAVDPLHANAKPAALDKRLLRAGAELASVLRGELHVFHAYMPLVVSVLAPTVQMVPAWIPPVAQDQYLEGIRSAFEDLARHSQVPARRRHLIAGDDTTALAQTVQRTGARIVVMGAVSRRGLRRIFIGNTAERVLDEVSADVLVVKPQGFKTSVPGVRSRSR